MKYMLDTDTCSFIIKKVPRPQFEFSKNLDECCISSVVYQELMVGLIGAKGTRHEESFMEFLQLIRVMPFSQADALTAADLFVANKKAGHNIGRFDNQIAGHAASAGLTLVSGNRKHFEPMLGLTVESWI